MTEQQKTEQALKQYWDGAITALELLVYLSIALQNEERKTWT